MVVSTSTAVIGASGFDYGQHDPDQEGSSPVHVPSWDDRNPPPIRYQAPSKDDFATSRAKLMGENVLLYI